MCLSHTDSPPYKCCCGCPHICGVIIIAVIEGFSLFASVSTFDIFGIVVSSILCLMFLVSFVRRQNYSLRKSLFLSYLVSMLLFLGYFIYFCVTQDMNDIIKSSCDTFNSVITWAECALDLQSTIWAFIAIYVFELQGG